MTIATQSIAELVGTFMFVSVIFLSASDPILIATGLLAAIVLSRRAGPAHLNPAVSTAMYVQRKINAVQYVSYVTAQVVGALAAIGWASCS